MPNQPQNPRNPDPGKQAAGRPDDRMPNRGNPGGHQIENLPGEGARRPDQGGNSGDRQRNAGAGGSNRPR